MVGRSESEIHSLNNFSRNIIIYLIDELVLNNYYSMNTCYDIVCTYAINCPWHYTPLCDAAIETTKFLFSIIEHCGNIYKLSEIMSIVLRRGFPDARMSGIQLTITGFYGNIYCSIHGGLPQTARDRAYANSFV